MNEVSNTKLYRGRSINLTNKIIIKQPTLDQISDFGENEYFQAIQLLTSVGADLKWQLWEEGIDYTQIHDYELFIKKIYRLVGSKRKFHYLLTNNPMYKEELEKISKEELDKMLINPLELILNIDFGDFEIMKKGEQYVLYNIEQDIVFDRAVYSQLMDVIRRIHGLKRNNQIPANERTKMDLIEDARDELMANANKPKKEILLPLVSAMKIKCGLTNNEVWNMKVYEFFYDLRRIAKIQDATLLLQGAYSGFASLKGVDKERLDWAGDIDI